MASGPFLVSLLIGAAVGAGELIARYRDAPAAALRSIPAVVYLALNGLAAVAALALLRALDIDLGLDEGDASSPWIQAMAAGLGAMAVFRSSLITVRAGDQDIGIGPSALLQILLGASDRAVDRLRAGVRAERVSEIMTGVRFEKAEKALTSYCLALMQNVPVEEQRALGDEVRILSAATDMDDEVKSLLLGLLLMNAVGPEVLKTAVESLDERVRKPGV